MAEQLGKSSLRFSEAVFIMESSSIVGKKEGEGPIGEMFDLICDSDRFGEPNWEQAECALQKEALTVALGKAKCKKEDVRFIFAGDLLGQDMATNFGLMSFDIALFGIYSACATIGEALMLASMMVAAGYGDKIAAVASSHFASAEKQFRFPLAYASQRPLCSTWTVTGSAAYIVSSVPSFVRIAGTTTGRIVDYGVRDTMNMGAAMAPAAALTISENLKDFGYMPKDYDAIVTGDLGGVGSEILLTLLMEQGIDISKQHKDCGMIMFDEKEQKTNAGGSGCGCSATVLSAYFLPKLKSGELKRILFVPTGALLSTVSSHEDDTIPGIAHGIILEHV